LILNRRQYHSAINQHRHWRCMFTSDHLRRESDFRCEKPLICDIAQKRLFVLLKIPVYVLQYFAQSALHLANTAHGYILTLQNSSLIVRAVMKWLSARTLRGKLRHFVRISVNSRDMIPFGKCCPETQEMIFLFVYDIEFHVNGRRFRQCPASRRVPSSIQFHCMGRSMFACSGGDSAPGNPFQ
jgi:hypothetical protein